MNRRVIGVVASVLLAALGTGLLVAYVRAAEQRALAGERLVEVLVAREDIARGTSSEDLVALVEPSQVPSKVRPEGAIADVAELAGKVAAVDLVAGEQLLASRFMEPSDLAARTGVEVPDGMQQVTVSLEPQRAFGGRLVPGDTVGFFASFAPDVMEYSTHLNLHKVLVTGVQAEQVPAGDDTEDPDQASPAPTGNFLVTMAVSAEDAEKVVFAAEHGTVWLSSESAEASEGGTQVQTPETIFE